MFGLVKQMNGKKVVDGEFGNWYRMGLLVWAGIWCLSCWFAYRWPEYCGMSWLLGSCIGGGLMVLSLMRYKDQRCKWLMIGMWLSVFAILDVVLVGTQMLDEVKLGVVSIIIVMTGCLFMGIRLNEVRLVWLSILGSVLIVGGYVGLISGLILGVPELAGLYAVAGGIGLVACSMFERGYVQRRQEAGLQVDQHCLST